MPEKRSVSIAGVLTLAAALGGIAAGERVEFVSPDPKRIVMGDTTVQFRVKAGDPPIESIDVYANGRLIGTVGPGEWMLQWYADPSEKIEDIVGVAFTAGRKVEAVRLEPRQAAAGTHVDVDLVQVYPVVTDSRGRYLTELRREDFRVLDDGEPVEIRYFTFEPTDLSLVLLLDGSESMVPFLEDVQVAACRFVDQLPPTNELAVYSFNHVVTRAIGLTLDHSAAKGAILDLEPSGSTALYDAIVRVVAEMQPVKGRKALFVFSDGRDRQSFASIDRVVDAARRNDVLIYAVATGEDEESMPARLKLGLIAEESGGRWFRIKNPMKIGEALSATLLDIQAQYRIGYHPLPGPAGVRTIDVTIPEKKRYSVRHRMNYFYTPTE